MSEENNVKDGADEQIVDKKFIRGDHGLAATFWGWGFGGSVVLMLFMSAILDGSGGESLAFCVMALFLGYSICTSIAIWRASDQYRGPAHWGVLSKIAVILSSGLVLLISLYLFAMMTSSYSNH